MIMVSEALAAQVESFMQRCLEDCEDNIRLKQAQEILSAFEQAKRGYPTGIKTINP